MATYPDKYGRNSDYRMLHKWVEQNLGKPKRCGECGTSEDRRYHWANLSGEYKKSLDDWIRLCVPCHSNFYGVGVKTHCKQGHPRTPENIRIKYYKNHAYKLCKACVSKYQAGYRLRRKELAL